MRQLTLRALPSAVDQQLRAVSRKNGKSINQTVIELLKKALGISDLPHKKRNVRHLAGTWTKHDAQEFAHHTKLFETIDREVWDK